MLSAQKYGMKKDNYRNSNLAILRRFSNKKLNVAHVLKNLAITKITDKGIF